MSFWLVGESPNLATVDRPDLWLTPDETGLPHSANRLLTFTGWTLSQFTSVFDHRTNVWSHPRWHFMAEGRNRAERIAEDSEGAFGVVVLGAMAATAFCLGGAAPLEWVGRFALVPHPSGRCRWWNSLEHRRRARAFFNEIMVRHIDSAHSPRKESS